MIDHTTIITPSAPLGGNRLAPGPGTLLPFGIVIPHTLPLPENFQLPRIATPSVSHPLVSSIVTTAPPPSDDGLARLILPKPGLPALRAPQVPHGWLAQIRNTSQRAVGTLPEGIRAGLARATNTSALRRLDRANRTLG